jgi:CRISPR-associated protein Cas1
MTSELSKSASPVTALPERPKTLGRIALPMAPPDLVPARMINEVLYCERLMYLEWSQGEFEENAFTLEGRTIVHARVDKPRKRRGKRRGAETEELVQEAEPPPYQARSVWLSSERLGITAKIDIIDEGEEGAVIPVEYKRGHVPEIPEQAYLPERAQVCAQALLLREHGYKCDEGSIYFAADRRRVRVELHDVLVSTTLEAAARARQLAEIGEIPPPLVDSPKCNGCSLVGICLPDETTLLQSVHGISRSVEPELVDDATGPMDADPWGLVSPAMNANLRRLHPARDDRVPVYAQVQGGYIALDGERLIVRSKEGGLEARLPTLRRSVSLETCRSARPPFARCSIAGSRWSISRMVDGSWGGLSRTTPTTSSSGSRSMRAFVITRRASSFHAGWWSRRS